MANELSTALSPLRKKLRRAYSLAANVQQQVDLLVAVSKQTDLDATGVEKKLTEMQEAIKKLVEDVRIGRGMARELAEMPVVASEIANSEQIVGGMDWLLSKLPPAQIARQLEVTDIDTVHAALRELASYENGRAMVADIQEQCRVVLEELKD